MQITIEIESQPDGYSVPERKPIYNPFDGILVLIGSCWLKAEDYLTSGGDTHICCNKLPSIPKKE